MLKRVSFRAKPVENEPDQEKDHLAEGSMSPTTTHATRKKTGRPSVLGTLLGLLSSTKTTEDGAQGDGAETRQSSPKRGPPSPSRSAQSRDSPLTRKASKTAGVAFDEDDPPTVFDQSDRKEPSRSAKPATRPQGSRREIMEAYKEGSSIFAPSQRGSKISELGSGASTLGELQFSKNKQNQPRYVMSARLPAMTIDNNDAESVNSFLSAHQLLESKPRAESDPTPLYGSTLEDDFGFEDEKRTGPDGKKDDDDMDEIMSRKSSFQKPRAPSFNTETRTWEGRRSLQLSVNPKGELGIGSIHISAATLDRLVEYVVSSNEFMEASQVSGFLLTYHSYVNSQGLLVALASRYDVSTEKKDQVARIRTLYVLQRWVEEHWYDFENDDLLLLGVVQFALTRLKAYDEKPEGDGSETTGDSSPLPAAKADPCYSLLKKLASVQQLAEAKQASKSIDEMQGLVTVAHEDEDDVIKQQQMEQQQQQQQSGESEDGAPKEKTEIVPRLLKHKSRLLIKLDKAPVLELPQNFTALWQSKMEGKAMHMVLANALVSKVEWARQLTIIEHHLYKRIPPTELIAQATKQMAKPPENVRTMITHFNDVSKFVAFSICSFSELTPRVYMLRKWIKIGRECLRLNNYNAVFEIMAGIHSVAVHRLHKTRASLNIKTKQILEKLEEVTSRKNNYATYRSLLAQNTVPIQPTVPFIGATLTDLSFLDFGHRNVVENGEGDSLINFTKHRRVAQVIGTIKKFQDHPYLLEVCPEIIKFLQTELHAASEVVDKDLYAMSLACEPPATAGSQAHAAFFGDHNEAPDGAPKAPKKQHKKEDSRAAFLFNKFGT